MVSLYRLIGVQVTRYAIAGIIGFFFNLLIYSALVQYLHVGYILAAASSLVLSFAIGFVIDKYWTFQNLSRNRLAKQCLKFFTVSTVTLTMSLSLLYLFTSFFGFNYILSQAFTMILSSFLSFAGHRNWVFKYQDKTL